MKKTAVICAVLLTLASSALAYKNEKAGFAVNDKQAITTTATENSYTFTCLPNPEAKTEAAHTINYITNEAATSVCGEKFSTSFFDEQYEKLALMKRCELSLKTVPLAIWNLDKYLEQGVELPYAKLDEGTRKELKSFLGVEKVGKFKVITVSHLYKQNRKLYALNTSFVSAADKLYALTTRIVDDEALASKEDDASEEVPAVIKRMQDEEAKKLVNLTPADLNAQVRSQIWEAHLKFIKSFKILK